jgi:hypothetical protein
MTRSRCVCGRRSDPPVGTFLEYLYPTATFCRGCGRRVIHCDCRRVKR